MSKANVQFPITPLRDNVILKLTSTASVLLTNAKNPISDLEITRHEVVAIGETVTNLSIGDNVIIPRTSYQNINVIANDKSLKKVLAKQSDIIGTGSLKRDIVEYVIVNSMDILAIDKQ